MTDRSLDSFGTRSELDVNGKKYTYFSLPKFSAASGKSAARLPYSLRILLENLLRCEDGKAVVKKDIEALAGWDPKAVPDTEIAVHPARVAVRTCRIPSRRYVCSTSDSRDHGIPERMIRP